MRARKGVEESAIAVEEMGSDDGEEEKEIVDEEEYGEGRRFGGAQCVPMKVRRSPSEEVRREKTTRNRRIETSKARRIEGLARSRKGGDVDSNERDQHLDGSRLRRNGSRNRAHLALGQDTEAAGHRTAKPDGSSFFGAFRLRHGKVARNPSLAAAGESAL